MSAKQWSCSRCTLLNHPLASKCSMCEYSKLNSWGEDDEGVSTEPLYQYGPSTHSVDTDTTTGNTEPSGRPRATAITTTTTTSDQEQKFVPPPTLFSEIRTGLQLASVPTTTKPSISASPSSSSSILATRLRDLRVPDHEIAKLNNTSEGTSPPNNDILREIEQAVADTLDHLTLEALAEVRGVITPLIREIQRALAPPGPPPDDLPLAPSSLPPTTDPISTSPVLISWKNAASRCFNSEKLVARRAGLQMYGDLARYIQSTFFSYSDKVYVTELLKQERVFEIALVERPDDRVIACLEDTLQNVEMDTRLVALLLTVAGSPAVQKVLGNVVVTRTLTEEMSIDLLSQATRLVISRNDVGARSLLRALSKSKTVRQALARNAKCVMSMARAIMSLILVPNPGNNNTIDHQSIDDKHSLGELQSILDSFHDVVKVAEFKFHLIDLCLETVVIDTQLVPVETVAQRRLVCEVDDFPPFPSRANPAAALTIVKVIISSFARSPVVPQWATVYNEEMARADAIRMLNHDWRFHDLLLSNTCLQQCLSVSNEDDACAEFSARLSLASFLARFSGAEPQIDFTLKSAIFIQVWHACKRYGGMNAARRFGKWLCESCSSECNPVCKGGTAERVINSMWNEEDLVRLNPQTWLALQTLFLEVNRAKGALAFEYRHIGESFRSRAPPATLNGGGGDTLVGRHVTILCQDESMQQADIVAYIPNKSMHVIEYLSGLVEERRLEDLNHWILFPSELTDLRAATPLIKGIAESKIVAADRVWKVALECFDQAAAQSASDLIVAMYEGGGGTSQHFVARVMECLEQHPGDDTYVSQCISLLHRLYTSHRCMSELSMVKQAWGLEHVGGLSCLIDVELGMMNGGPALKRRIVADSHLPLQHFLDLVFNKFRDVISRDLVSDYEVCFTRTNGGGNSTDGVIGEDTSSSSRDSMLVGGTAFPVSYKTDKRLLVLPLFHFGVVGDIPTTDVGASTTTNTSAINVPTLLTQKCVNFAFIFSSKGGSNGGNATIAESSTAIVPYTRSGGPSTPGPSPSPPPPIPDKATPQTGLSTPSSFDEFTGIYGDDTPTNSPPPPPPPPTEPPLVPPFLTSAQFELLFHLMSSSTLRQYCKQRIWAVLQALPYSVVEETCLVVQGDLGHDFKSLYRCQRLAAILRAASSGMPPSLSKHATQEHHMTSMYVLENLVNNTIFINNPMLACNSTFPILELAKYFIHVDSIQHAEFFHQHVLQRIVQWIVARLHVLSAELTRVLGEEIIQRSGGGNMLHTCSLPPSLCEGCLDIRRLQHGSFQLLDALRLLGSVWMCLVPRPGLNLNNSIHTMAQLLGEGEEEDALQQPASSEESSETDENERLFNFCWTMLCKHPSSLVRQRVARLLQGFVHSNDMHVFNALTQCEVKLEDFLMDVLTKRNHKTTLTVDDFSVLYSDVCRRRSDMGVVVRDHVEKIARALIRFLDENRRRPVLEDRVTSVVDTNEVVWEFANHLAGLLELTGSSSTMMTDLFSAVSATFLITPPMMGTTRARKAMSRLMIVLVPNNETLMVRLMSQLEDSFMETPTPLRRQDQGWKFQVDWNVDPTSMTDRKGCLKLRGEQNAAGLLNRGSTCYAISVLQLLFFAKPFRDAIINVKVPPPPPPSSQPPLPLSPPSQQQPAIVSAPESNEHIQIATKHHEETSHSSGKIVVVAWRCWCSGVNDLPATQCHICETAKPEEPEWVTETFHEDLSRAVTAEPGNGSTTTPPSAAATTTTTITKEGEETSPSNSNNNNNEDATINVLRELQRLFTLMRDSKQACVDPFDLISKCTVLRLPFPVTSQNDSSEFLVKLLDTIDGALQAVEKCDPIGAQAARFALKSCFEGKLEHVRTCKTCGTEIRRWEPFQNLEITLEGKNNLEDGLQTMMKTEDLVGDNAVECEQCKGKTPSVHVTRMSVLPPFLVLSFKRFQFQLDTMSVAKLNHYVKFPRTFDTNGFVTSKLTYLNNTYSAGEIHYQLAGVVVHRGRAGGGHYYVYLQPGMIPHYSDDASIQGEDGWIHMNDDKVSKFDPNRLGPECFGGSDETERGRPDQEKSAVILLYVAVVGREAMVVQQPPQPIRTPLTRPSVVRAASSGPAGMMDDIELTEEDLFTGGGVMGGGGTGKRKGKADNDDGGKTLSPVKTSAAITLPLNKKRNYTESMQDGSAAAPPMTSSTSVTTVHVRKGTAISTAFSLPESILSKMIVTRAEFDLNKYRSGMRALVARTNRALVSHAVLFDFGTFQGCMLDMIKKYFSKNVRINPAVLKNVVEFVLLVVARTRNAPMPEWLRVIEPACLTCQSVCDEMLDDLMTIHGTRSTSWDTELGPPLRTMCDATRLVLECNEPKTRWNHIRVLSVLVNGASETRAGLLVRSLITDASSPTTIQGISEASRVAGLAHVLSVLISRECIRKEMRDAKVLNMMATAFWNNRMVASVVTNNNKSEGQLLNHEFLSRFNDIGIMIGGGESSALATMEFRDAVIACIPVVKDAVTTCTNLVRMHCEAGSGADMVMRKSLVMGCLSKLVDELDFRGGATTTATTTTTTRGKHVTTSDRASDPLDAGDVGASAVMNVMEAMLNQSLDQGVLTADDVLETMLTKMAVGMEFCRRFIISPDGGEESVMVGSDRIETVFASQSTIRPAFVVRCLFVLVSAILRDGAKEDWKQALHQWMGGDSNGGGNDAWRLISLWYLVSTSPWNQCVVATAMDTDKYANLRTVMSNLASESDLLFVARAVGSRDEEIDLFVDGDAAVAGIYHLSKNALYGEWPRYYNERSRTTIFRRQSITSDFMDEWALAGYDSTTGGNRFVYYTTSHFPRNSLCRVPPNMGWHVKNLGRYPGPNVVKVLKGEHTSSSSGEMLPLMKNDEIVIADTTTMLPSVQEEEPIHVGGVEYTQGAVPGSLFEDILDD